MTSGDYIIVYNDFGKPYIAHHGIKGQRWGVRRFQNLDGSYTPAGRERYGIGDEQASDGGALSAEQKVKLKEFENSHDKFSRELLKKNANAAVVNPDLNSWIKSHKNELAIAGRIALGAAAVGAGVYLVKNSDTIAYDLQRFSPLKDNAEEVIDKISDVKIKDVDIPDVQIPDVKPVADYGGFENNEKRFIAQWLKADMHRYDAITPQEFENMSNESVTLQAGEKMFRLSKGEHGTLRDGIEYVSFGKDRERYLGFLPQMWRANGASNRQFFEAQLKAVGEIKAPGKKESIEILEACLRKQYPHAKDSYIRQVAFSNFYKVQANLIDRNYELGKMFLKEANSRGYNAVVDWNDAGRLTDKPLILMNGAKQATIENVQKYSYKETREIFKNIELPSNVADFTKDDFYKEPLAFLYTPYIDVYAR